MGPPLHGAPGGWPITRRAAPSRRPLGWSAALTIVRACPLPPTDRSARLPGPHTGPRALPWPYTAARCSRCKRPHRPPVDDAATHTPHGSSGPGPYANRRRPSLPAPPDAPVQVAAPPGESAAVPTGVSRCRWHTPSCAHVSNSWRWPAHWSPAGASLIRCVGGPRPAQVQCMSSFL